ncbi:serine/threonine-protein phosphatase [Nonomuraea turkmeniaca]|uniref:Serine/threonine-protein phosphatase n=1 Tax=Nonomuraea turkmeniaca TaxID=103838 RepID=A0A5S4F2S9_9ACTN|nr:PP2C family protein-serine/threonine phosphatase [Nonomuraea turkmeniaca]TMR10408.1 serine/threonine-protein phosphatase [Nonomuraea turkmeniaca]
MAEVFVALADAVYIPVLLPALLLAGPVIAAHCLTVLQTVLLTATALVLALLLPVLGDGAEPLHYVARTLIVAVGGLLCVAVAQRHERQRADLSRITRIAERAMIPALPAELGSVRLAAHTRSAAHGARIGGDLHEAIATAAGARLIIGDVKGHGLDAAHLSAAVLSTFRRIAATAPDLACLARDLDARLGPDLGPEDFVTVLLADFVPGGVLLVNCGHPAPIRIDNRLRVLEPPRSCRPLGLSPDPYVWRVRLLPTDRLLLFTDGFTEARDRSGAHLPFDEHLHTALTAPTLGEALRDLLDLLHDHATRACSDDMTLILAQPGSHPPSPPHDH